jgi:transcriptional regulator with XRE-family HTH domain
VSGAHSDLTQPAGAEHPAAEAFIAELKHWREVRGLSQKRLAGEMGYDPSYISKIESGQQHPTRDFAHRADEVLHSGGGLVRRWRDYCANKPPGRAGHARQEPAHDAHALAQSLIVCHEQAECRYADGAYHMRMRRKLHNASDAPVTRYLIRISVDRHPKTPDRSNELYRTQPLTWDELELQA